MATKRKAKKKGGRRRHKKMGALNPSSPLVQIVSAAAGFFAADKYVNPTIDKFTGTMDEKLKAGGQVGIGALLVFNKHTKKHLIAVIPGAVVAGAGLKRGLRAIGVITGYQDVPAVGNRVNGYGKVKVIGTMPQNSLNGTQGGFMVPKPIGSNVMGNASGSGLRHDSSDFLG